MEQGGKTSWWKSNEHLHEKGNAKEKKNGYRSDVCFRSPWFDIEASSTLSPAHPPYNSSPPVSVMSLQEESVSSKYRHIHHVGWKVGQGNHESIILHQGGFGMHLMQPRQRSFTVCRCHPTKYLLMLIQFETITLTWLCLSSGAAKAYSCGRKFCWQNAENVGGIRVSHVADDIRYQYFSFHFCWTFHVLQVKSKKFFSV